MASGRQSRDSIAESVSDQLARRRPRRFGILTFPIGPSSAIESEWRWAEEAGFDQAWLPDSFSNPGVADFEVWTLLGVLAKVTSRLRIGTLVTTIIARHPLLLAAQVQTVDQISGGRVELGIGVGDPEQPECEAFGLPRWPPAERIGRLEEQLALLDDLLRGNEVKLAGRYYSVDGARLAPSAQVPRPPLLVSAEGPRALRLTARHAEAWATLAGHFGDVRAGQPGNRASQAEAVARTKTRVADLERFAAEFGRPADSIRRLVLAYRLAVDPLTSLDAFDDFVEAYARVGIDEFVFYWPPVANIRERHPVSPAQRSVVERIAVARLRSPQPATS